MELSGYEYLKTFRTVLMPKYVPLLGWLFNRVFAKLPLINRLCFIQVIVARLDPLSFRKPSTLKSP